MTIRELAKYLHLGVATLYKMTRAGEIPAAKIATQWRYSKHDVDAWVKSKRQNVKQHRDSPSQFRVVLTDDTD